MAQQSRAVQSRAEMQNVKSFQSQSQEVNTTDGGTLKTVGVGGWTRLDTDVKVKDAWQVSLSDEMYHCHQLTQQRDCRMDLNPWETCEQSRDRPIIVNLDQDDCSVAMSDHYRKC